MLPGYELLQLPDQLLSRVQSNIAKAFSRLTGPTGIAFLDGVAVTTSLAASANTVNHKLGRAPQGWILLRKNAAAHVYESNTTPFTATTLALTASAPVTVTLWVF